MSDTTTADRAYIRQAANPADAAGRAAALHGITLTGDAARGIADAVLGHADGRVSASVVVISQAWGYPDARKHAFQQLQRQLFDEITSRRVLPTALPSRTDTYTSWGHPDRIVESWDTWTQVEITLTVPVRTP